jgi:hypothetical protein
MKNGKPIKLWAVALLASASAILLASSLLISQDYEKVCPITFRLYPGTWLETSCAARVEKDNVKLSGFLSALRTNKILRDIGFNAWRDKVKAILAEKASEGEKALRLKDMSRDLFGMLDKSETENPFSGTYLEDPKLTTEGGVTVVGIAAVVVELDRIVSASTYVDAQSVHVELEYLPIKTTGYFDAQKKFGTTPDNEVDMIAHIKTVLAYAPKDAPATIEGLLPHRKVCFDF